MNEEIAKYSDKYSAHEESFVSSSNSFSRVVR